MLFRSEGAETGLPRDGEQQHARHHDEERHARADEAPGEDAGEERRAVGVELRDEGVAAVGEDHQQAGDRAQQVDPADGCGRVCFHVGSFEFTKIRFSRQQSAVAA